MTPRAEIAPAPPFQVLMFAPAILRMSVAGKDANKELDALAGAVAQLGFPRGVSTERVFSAASEIARLIKAEGADRIHDRIKTELTPEVIADTMRLALVAALMSPVRDPSDIAILWRTAARLGLGKAEFDALHEGCKALI